MYNGEYKLGDLESLGFVNLNWSLQRSGDQVVSQISHS